MQVATRTAARSARRLRPQTPKQSRRNASDSHGHDSHGSSAHSSHPPPANESFGASFYITLAAIPATFALYKLTQPGADGKQPYFTRLIQDTYAGYKTKWADRNDFHTQAVQMAAEDRLLFTAEGGHGPRTVDLRYPEQFNHGSPFNVPAGHGSANIDALIKKYETEAFEANEQKLQQLRDNNVPREQPFKTYKKTKTVAAES